MDILYSQYAYFQKYFKNISTLNLLKQNKNKKSWLNQACKQQNSPFDEYFTSINQRGCGMNYKSLNNDKYNRKLISQYGCYNDIITIAMNDHFKLFDFCTTKQIGKQANHQLRQNHNTFKSCLRKKNLTEQSKQLTKTNEKKSQNLQSFINQQINHEPLKIQIINSQQHSMLEQKPTKLQSINMNHINMNYQSAGNNSFRITLTNRRPLLFIKPYLRYRNQSLTIMEKKEEIYKEITNQRLQLGKENYYGGNNFIEYFTQFNKTPLKVRKQENIKAKLNHNRTSFNIIRTKLQKYYKA